MEREIMQRIIGLHSMISKAYRESDELMSALTHEGTDGNIAEVNNAEDEPMYIAIGNAHNLLEEMSAEISEEFEKL